MPTDLQLPIMLLGGLMVLPAIPTENSLARWWPGIRWEQFHFELRMWWRLAGLLALATLLRDIPFGLSVWAGSVLVGFVAFATFKYFVSNKDFTFAERGAILAGYLAIPFMQMRFVPLAPLIAVVALIMLWQMRWQVARWAMLLWGWVSTALVVSQVANILPSPVGALSAVMQQPLAAFDSDNLLLIYLICLVVYFGVLRELNRILR